MKLAVFSDSHDNVPLIQRAVSYFQNREINFVIHAGDFVAPFSLRPILASGCQFLGVFGNNDGEKVLLTKVSEGRIFPGPKIEYIGGYKILVSHELEPVEELAQSGSFHLIVWGHSHIPEIKRVGETLVVNPGELGGWLYGRSTFAVVDLDKKEAEIIEL